MGVLWAPVAAHAHMQDRGAPPVRLVRQAPDHRVTRLALASAASTPPVLTSNPASQHCMVWQHALARHFQAQVIQARERAQIRAIKGSIGHVEVFQMDGVGISIIERPRPLPQHDTPNPTHNTYTLKCEEPHIIPNVQIVLYNMNMKEQPTPDKTDFINVLKRSSLIDFMPDREFDQVVHETYQFIDRRFKSLRSLVQVDQTNINPFLMLAMAPAYNIFSPYEAAAYLQDAKMPHGDATSFGKFVEDKIFPIFGVTSSQEKQLNPKLYSAIDAALTVEDTNYLATWKSGPWTMNQSHANEMSRDFPEIHKITGKTIILGVFYGTRSQLNNKPALVRGQTGEYFQVLIGSELWEFVTGVRKAHMEILRAIRVAQQRWATAHGGKTFNEHVIEARLQLSEDFRNTFGLTGGDEDMWEMLFEHAF